MSTSTRLLSIALAITLSACVKPGDRFDDFASRVVDADTTRIDGATLAELPDITGSHLLAISPSLAPTQLLQFSCAATLDLAADKHSGVLALACTALTVAGRQPTGSPLSATDVAVNAAGEFAVKFVGTVPGAANSVVPGSDIVTPGLTLHGRLKDADFFCGDITGGITAPLAASLDGSTFAAQRITPGTVGDALPQPIAVCPSGNPVDAGPIDAAIPDAGTPDAAP